MDGRKRKKPSNSTSTSLDPVGLRVSSAQLLSLWTFDNECAKKFMRGCPLWTCSVHGTNHNIMDDDEPDEGVTDVEFALFKDAMKEMWLQASAQFEVSVVKGEESKGHRLFVRKDLLSKVVIREADAVSMGWFAQVPTALSSSHIFLRSYVHPNCYLGGPISYANWSRRESVHTRQSIFASNRHFCKMWTAGSLPPGAEVLWNYGHHSAMPDSGQWFKEECCSITSERPAEMQRYQLKVMCKQYMYREKCVLCGFQFSVDNKDNRVQYKPHLAGSHADFFGSSSDGTGEYKNEPIDPNVLFAKVDTCNFIMSHLRQMNWRVLPACELFSEEELQDFLNDESIMASFKLKFESFRKAVILIVRGCEVPSGREHFRPVQGRPWKYLTWSTADGKPPPKGRYAVPSHLKDSHESSLPVILSEFCSKNLA